MKKQLTKIKIAAGNLSRSNKQDHKDFELELAEKQVDKYRDVLEKMVRKLPAVTTTTDQQERDKRIKKNSHYKIGQALEESSKELPKELPLHRVLTNCGELEKSLAECIVESELETETEVVRRLKLLLDNEIQEISTLKRNVSRTLQEHTSLKRSYEAAILLAEPMAKINHIKEQQEQCEVKLEKERDSLAAQMFELIAKEDEIVQCIRDYVLNQRNYHERALNKVNTSLDCIQDIIQTTVKSRFGTSLSEHLESTKREISYVMELCICCLIEYGLFEEGLLRVGCASTKLRRMKHALEAQHIKTPLPLEYQDPHVIGSILKLYLRELPEPLLTFKCYKDFLRAVERTNDAERKSAIKATLLKLPTANYANLRYLTKFLWLVTQNVEQNKMSSQNLAIVMSPNMLWPRVDKTNPNDYINQVNSSSAVNVIVELLISQWDYFFDGDVDFFLTLQQNKLFVEGKTKSNSSNEHLERHDNEHLESPRYGTIRRQKPCAPSPPAKIHDIKAQNNGNVAISAPMLISNPIDANYNNNDITSSSTTTLRNGVKELFPNVINNQSIDKPEKPPLPKLTQNQQSVETPKPVPMTRTQFFGLDNLPSPVADRKSADSLGGHKPDLPQKPKLPKRPIVLGLSNAGKSDEETTPTSAHSSDGAINGANECIRHKLTENCDNNTTKLKDSNNGSSQQLILAEQISNINLNVKSNADLNVSMTKSGSALSVNETTSSTTQTPTTALATPSMQRMTPTTPISPNMILTTPKRPTVPAPPPPSIVKKQTD